MKTITKKYEVYYFDELSEASKEKAISDHINFEVEIMDETSPYYHCAVEMEKMQTPWFLGECVYDEHKNDIIETIKINNYLFLENGEFFPKN